MSYYGNIITGVSGTQAAVTDHEAVQVTAPPEGKTAFGETSVAEPTPIIQLQFPYGLNTALVTPQNNQSGSASVATSMAQLSTGAAANSSATLLSNKAITYQPGLGVKARFTAAETPIMSFRVKEVFQGTRNRSRVKINYVATSVEHTKPCFINFYTNATLTDASFADINSGVSSLEQDTSATAASGGIFFFGIPLGKSGQTVLDLKDDPTIGDFGPGTIVTATLAPNSTNGAEGNVSFNFTEKF